MPTLHSRNRLTLDSALLCLTSLESLAGEAAPSGRSQGDSQIRTVVWGERANTVPPPDASARGPLTALPAGSAAVLQLLPLAEPVERKSFATSSEREGPLRLGEPRDTLQVSLARLRVDWAAPVEGRRTARLAISSPGARALRVALRTDSIQSMDVRVRGSAQGAILGSRHAPDARQPQQVFWTPITDGEHQDIELSIEDQPDLPLPRIIVPKVSHFLAPMDPASGSGGLPARAKSNTCNEAIACQPSPSAAFTNAARAVVKLVFTRLGTSYSCTGTLINDGEAQTQIPYVLTAAHCVDTQSTAASTNAFFFFDAATCGSTTVPTFRQISSGATLVHVNTTTDIALLRFNEPAPQGAWFSGWDAALVPDGSAALFIHHPDSGPKAFSLGLTVPPTPGDEASGQDYRVTWLSGSSAAGSSGGGLLTLADDQYFVRGVLRGGSANCAFSGQRQNPLNRDIFAQLDEDAAALRRILLGGPAPLQNYGDLWNSTTELGWGMTIFQSADNQLLLSWYTHDDSSNPVWYLSLGGKWVSAVRYEGMLARVRGTPATVTYDPARLSTSNVGTVALEFSSSSRADMTFTLNGVTRTKPLKRFTFGP